jgi:hypothetical protein
MTVKTHSGTPKGYRVIEEAARLLQQMRFSQTHGAYAEGQFVAISVDPRWNDDLETFCVLISCYALGHRRVDWAMLPVHILPEDRKAGVHAIARLNTRGQTVLPRLQPGEYHLTLRLRTARVQSVLSQRSERLAAQGEDEEQEERRVWQGEGEDGAVLWTMEETEEGDVQIAFETSAAHLAGFVVTFSLVDAHSKAVRYSQRLTLEPTRTPGKWEGWCSLGSRADFPGPYELMFEVEPPDQTE